MAVKKEKRTRKNKIGQVFNNDVSRALIGGVSLLAVL